MILARIWLFAALLVLGGCDSARRSLGNVDDERFDAVHVEPLAMKSFCSDRTDATNKNTCLEDLAVRFRNAALCHEAEDEFVDLCLRTFARETGDATACAGIRVDMSKKLCVESTVHATRSSNSCRGLPKTERDECADDLAKLIMMMRKSEPFFFDCAVYEDREKQRTCRWEFALFGGDSAPCREIEDAAARKTCELLADPDANSGMSCPPEIHQACVRRVAELRPWRCFELAGQARKDCLVAAGVGPGDVSQCAALPEGDRALCTASYAILLKNPLICGVLEGEPLLTCARLGDEFDLDLRVCLFLPEGSERATCASKRSWQIDRLSYCALLPVDQRVSCENRVKYGPK